MPPATPALHSRLSWDPSFSFLPVYLLGFLCLQTVSKLSVSNLSPNSLPEDQSPLGGVNTQRPPSHGWEEGEKWAAGWGFYIRPSDFQPGSSFRGHQSQGLLLASQLPLTPGPSHAPDTLQEF